MLLAQRSRTFLHQLNTFRFSTSTNFPSLLHLCKKPIYLFQVHDRLVVLGFCENSTFVSQLIETYANFGLICASKKILYSLAEPNSFHYNAIVRSLDKLHDFDGILSTYQEMISESVCPDEETIHLVICACLQLMDAPREKKVRGHMMKLGLNDFLVNDQPDETAKVLPELSTLLSSLKFSTDQSSLKLGRTIHCVALVDGMYDLDFALLSMYSKLGSLKEAAMMFERIPRRDSAAWNMMISSYCQFGNHNKSMALLREMILSGVSANLYTILHGLSSIRKMKSVMLGKQMHSYSIRNYLDVEPSIHNALIDMYFICGCVNYAERSFDLVFHKDLVTWSTMIKGYVKHDRPQDALSLFQEMRSHGSKVDDVLILNLLPASVKVGGSELVKLFHCYLVKLGLNLQFSISSSLLVSYAKSGLIDMARQLFEESDVNRDIVVWNSMIGAYAKHGDWFECLKLYRHLKAANLTPDEVTFLGLLTACVNSGRLEEGRAVFKEMTEIYRFSPNQEHYACLVDLLGRTGHLKEACEVIKLMPFDPEARIWTSLLSASKKHRNSNLAAAAGDKLMGMEAKNAGNYILLSNIYAAAGQWDMVAKTRSFLKEKRIRKAPGISSIEMNGKLHEFVSGGSHPRADEIYRVLRNIELKTKKASYFLELSVMNS